MKCRIPKSLEKASKMLVASMIEHYGGVQEVANKARTNKQSINNFRDFGYVTLSQVNSIAIDLGVSPWVLSYKKLYEVFGLASPDFAVIVKESPLTPEAKRKILALLK